VGRVRSAICFSSAGRATSPVSNTCSSRASGCPNGHSVDAPSGTTTSTPSR
jgi:hypothetical protein